MGFGVAVFAWSCVEIREALMQAAPESLVPQGAPPRFFDIGSFGGPTMFAQAINEKGQVVGGGVDEDGLIRAFIWSEQEGIVDIGSLGTQARAFAVNNLGHVGGTGNTEDETAELSAFIWTPEEGMRALPHFEVGPSTVTGINDDGVACGWSRGPPPEGAAQGFPQPVRWTADGKIEHLGTLGGNQGIANGINNAGQICGMSNLEDGTPRAFLWTAAKGMEEIGTLGGNMSEANDINELGDIVGRSNLEERGNRQPFFWSRETGMIDLGTVGGTGGQAFGINDLRQIVGVSSTASGGAKAFYATVDGGMIQLLDLGASQDNDAQDINNAGVVVGEIDTGTGDRRAVIWK